VHLAGYITYGSVLSLILLFVLAAIDDFIFGSVLREYLEIIGKLGLGGFAIGCVLIVLSTNKII
jgi:hypothetical protein